MTRRFTASELGKLAGVTQKTIDLWRDAASNAAAYAERVGGLNAPAHYDLTEAQDILRAGKREELASLLGELAFAQSLVESTLAEGELPRNLADSERSDRGRPVKRLVPVFASTAFLAGESGRELKDMASALYLRSTIFHYVDGETYVGLDSLPESVVAEFAARLATARVDMSKLAERMKDSSGEIWIKGTELARLLGWSRALVAQRGWRCGWNGRKTKHEGHEYELGSLPEDLQIRVLRAVAFESGGIP